jgi:hypothetical protein
MLFPRIVVSVAVLLLASPMLADESQKPKKPKRPGVELRFTPRYSFSPANVSFTLELKGGDDMEEYYCPEIEWEWGDGSKSVQEADCDPWAADSKVQRRFTGSHLFPQSGVYTARVTLRKSDKTIVTKSVEVTVQPGFGVREQDRY